MKYYYYVTKSKKHPGILELRQEKFRKHPSKPSCDLCAVARSVREMQAIVRAVSLSAPVDYSEVENG